uniref:Uncharacterized protein n=1 Tax=Arundo donax TaxID=35708 RepID=A0A0A9D244_ARUDO
MLSTLFCFEKILCTPSTASWQCYKMITGWSLSFLPKCIENGKKPTATKHHAEEKAEPEIYIP